MQSLTPRQQAALDRILSQGNHSGIDSGMIAALTRKGVLGGIELQAQPRQTVAPETPDLVPTEPGALVDYSRKKWPSLTALRDSIQADGLEQVECFDGVTLRTNHRVFGLSFDQLTVSMLEDA
jgi:hypothetical protein